MNRRPVITVKLQGRLGNQMFQYAAAYGLAKRLGTSIRTYRNQAMEYLLDCWRLPKRNIVARWSWKMPGFLVLLMVAESSPRFRIFSRLLYRCLGDRYVEKKHICDRRFFHQRPGAILDGYFQNQHYFSDCEEEIRAFFQPKKALSAPARRHEDQIRRTAYPVAVHIRRTDFRLLQRHFPMLGREYYQGAIRTIDQMSGGKAHYFVFSDDIHEAVTLLTPIIGRSMTVIDGTQGDWEAMILMSRCRDQIIANSTFAWWGAWLNPREDKNVIAPRRWVTQYNAMKRSFIDVVPDDWITM